RTNQAPRRRGPSQKNKGRPGGRPLRKSWRRQSMAGSVADVVLGLAHGALHLADGLVGLAFGLQLHVAAELAGCVLDGTLDLLASAVDPILVHLKLLWFQSAGERSG